MIKAVVFDLDGVYFESGTPNFIKSLEDKFELSEEQIAKVYFKSDEMQKYKRGEINGDEYWSWAISKWGINSTKDEIIKMLMDGYEENDETVQYVRSLRKKGIKNAICTNNFPERLEGLNKKFGLFDNFDVIVASYHLGVTKPDKRIFDTLASKLECLPSEILMSDDREDNVKALEDLGFKAVMYKDWKGFVSKVEKYMNS